MARAQTEHERYREIEQRVSVAVIDLADKGEACEQCGEKKLTFYVSCFREETRPIAALCKRCASERAGGEDKVYVKEARGPGLRTRWQAGARIALRTEAQLAALREGLARKARENAKPPG